MSQRIWKAEARTYKLSCDHGLNAELTLTFCGSVVVATATSKLTKVIGRMEHKGLKFEIEFQQLPGSNVWYSASEGEKSVKLALAAKEVDHVDAAKMEVDATAHNCQSNGHEYEFVRAAA